MTGDPYRAADETGAESPPHDPTARKVDPNEPPEPMPWDRWGMFLEDLATAGKNMTDRNLNLWSSISTHLRQRPYRPVDLTEDMARGLEAAMANVQEAWESVVRAPERERVADTLPTAFLVFTPRKETMIVDGKPQQTTFYDTVDPVWMRVRGSDLDRLPPTAEIELSGDREGVEALRKCLSTRLGESRQAYLLRPSDVHTLVPGVYGGTVYIKTPNVRPIANLRIIVEQDKP